MKILLAAGLLLIAVAAIFSIISTAIPYWVNYTFEDGSIYFGLWQVCNSAQTINECVDIDSNVEDWMKAVRAMAVLGVISLCLSAVFAGLFAKFSNNRCTAVLSVVLAIIGGVCYMISIIVFGVKEKEIKSDFGAAFYLGIVAAILAFVAGIIITLAQRLTSGYASF